MFHMTRSTTLQLGYQAGWRGEGVRLKAVQQIFALIERQRIITVAADALRQIGFAGTNCTASCSLGGG
jgi:hypothetical protein